MIRKLPLGRLLLESKKISQEQLDKALLEQQETGTKLGSVLIAQGSIKEVDLLCFLAKQLNIPYLDILHYPVKDWAITKVNEKIARRYRAIPIDVIKDSYLIAMADPTDLNAYDELSRVLDKPLRVAVVKETELLNIIDANFRRTAEIKSLVSTLEQEITDVTQGAHETDVDADAPIKKLLQSIFEDAVQMNASDIHIEPDETVFRIRQRIDGTLHEQVMQGKAIVSALVLRLKLMAKLNISERRRPQDGRFDLAVNGKKIDVRIATMPVAHGESVAMRILDHDQNVKDISELGMTDAHALVFKKYLAAPHGMILVTGPTGSGKTTSLYAGLLAINDQSKKIITVEDPVEYAFDRLNQVQVQPQIGLTFANVLRSALRHDPDVIMVGEIRDEETASIALRSALTGHLVLSTIHTFDSLSAPIRLIDMGVPSFLVASSLRCVIAQRLIRRICDGCRTQATLDQKQSHWLKKNLGLSEITAQHLRGKGCTQCQMTGYKGRIGVFEVLEISEEMSDAIRKNDFKALQQLSRTQGFLSYVHHAYAHATAGLTDINEVIRLAVEQEDDRLHGAQDAFI